MIKWNFFQQENGSQIQVDASFRYLPNNTICFHIWKVDEDRVEIVPKENFGCFNDDCCYLVYAACPVGTYVSQETVAKEVKSNVSLERFIHFWLGSKVNQQKKANAAHKVMELDSYFGNIATEYRESQFNESVRFKSYFKRGITIFSGEAAAAPSKSRLFQISGRQWLCCVQMESVEWRHFSSEYMMILSTDKRTFVWMGRATNVGDRREALKIAKRLQNSGIVADVVIIDDGYEQSMKDEEKQLWNEYLPLNDRAVNQEVPSRKPICNMFKLYKCGYKESKYWIDQVTSTLPSQNDLNDTTAVYILNAFSFGVWMWIGRNAARIEKKEAIRNGRGFIKKKKYPQTTLLIRVIEGHEPMEFTELFPNWLDNEPKTTQIHGKFDTQSLAQRPRVAAENQLIDDGTGEKFVYEVTEDRLGSIALRKSAAFFRTNYCYVVQYTVASNARLDVGINNIVYVWIGKLASNEVNSKCTKFARDQFHKQVEKTMIVRMNEGDETPNFLQIFGGKFIILESEKETNENAHNNNNNSPEKSSKLDIFKVQGESTFTSRAWQVQSIKSLFSHDCYVILNNSMVYVWCGQHSTGDAREVAKTIGSIFNRELTLVMEGKESKEFWNAVSQQINQAVVSNGSSSMNELPKPPKVVPIDKGKVHLHLVYLHSGKIISHEIYGFTQSDLLPENTYILDAHSITFVWCGKLSFQIDENAFAAIAREFLETTKSSRRTTAVALVKQHNEPNIFTGFFDNWNRKLWDSFVPFERKRSDPLRKASTTGANSTSTTPMPPLKCLTEFDQHHKFPLAVLQQEVSALPKEVNPLSRELHLTHDDFVGLFDMSYVDFSVLPAWKKQELKKKVKLF